MTIQEQNKVIDGYSNSEFVAVLLQEFGPLGMANLLGWAALYGLTWKNDAVQARDALIGLGLSPVAVYRTYSQFRRLRRVLLARRGIVADERRSGPGLNVGVPFIIERVQALHNTHIDSIIA